MASHQGGITKAPVGRQWAEEVGIDADVLDGVVGLTLSLVLVLVFRVTWQPLVWTSLQSVSLKPGLAEDDET